MYGWIWRHLPFGRPGKAIGSLLLVAAAMAALWYVVFPRVESYMPWNDGQITTSDNGGNIGPGGGPGGSGGNGSESAPPPGVIPYNDQSNNPEPTATPSSAPTTRAPAARPTPHPTASPTRKR